MLKKIMASFAVTAFVMCGAAMAQPAATGQTPDALIQQVSNEVLEAVKADSSVRSGNVQRIVGLVDSKVMPHVDFPRMTAAVVSRYWRQATPEQQKRLEEEFKLLLVRTYAGALTQVNAQTTIGLKPSRSSPADKEVVVRTEVRGQGDPVQLDYRLASSPTGWKIYDVNVLGVWLVEQYRSSFSQEISTNGLDGLINKLAERNKAAAAKS
ncbi:MAG: toluene tolerance family protein [Rhizobacter sp.]|nr:toluene tolerance family protein [Rhizobacter sp.]